MLGWFTADVRGVHLVYHNGENPGFRAKIVLAPSSKAGVVILTNGEPPHLFTDAATRSLLEQLFPSPIRAKLATSPIASQIKPVDFPKSAVGHEDQLPPSRLSAHFSIAANVKPRPDHLITAVLRFGSPVIRGSRFSSRSASGRLMMG